MKHYEPSSVKTWTKFRSKYCAGIVMVIHHNNETTNLFSPLYHPVFKLCHNIILYWGICHICHSHNISSINYWVNFTIYHVLRRYDKVPPLTMDILRSCLGVLIRRWSRYAGVVLETSLVMPGNKPTLIHPIIDNMSLICC